MSNSEESVPLKHGAGSLILEEAEEAFYIPKPKPVCCFSYSSACLLHLCALVVYTTIALAVFVQQSEEYCHEEIIYSPLRKSLRWAKVEQDYGLDTRSPYMGFGTPESDAAWGKLLAPMNTRIDGETLHRLGRGSVQLQDGSGTYLGHLAVYHNLHCIKEIRHAVIQDPDTRTPGQWEHVDHCLEAFRLTMMCNPDLHIITYDWLENFPRPWGNFHDQHECVDWNSITEWVQERSFTLFDQTSIVHPLHGVAFPLDSDGHPAWNSSGSASPEDRASIKAGTNPKGNWGP